MIWGSLGDPWGTLGRLLDPQAPPKDPPIHAKGLPESLCTGPAFASCVRTPIRILEVLCSDLGILGVSLTGLGDPFGGSFGGSLTHQI